MSKETLVKAILFFEQYSSDPIRKDTEVNNDLGLIGDDADAMLLAFMEKFNVNLENINFTNYFVPELVFKYWYYKWFKPDKLKRRPLTVEHMAEVAERGHWFEPTY